MGGAARDRQPARRGRRGRRPAPSIAPAARSRCPHGPWSSSPSRVRADVTARRTATDSRGPDSGIQKFYVDALGRRHAAPRDTVRAIERVDDGGLAFQAGRDTLVVRAGPSARRAGAIRSGSAARAVDRSAPAADLPIGYHELAAPEQSAGAADRRPCGLPSARGFRTWGWAIQLYAARSRRSWGIGDLADLRWLGRWARRQGAGIALINPLAAAAPTLPQQPSPYFPSSRRFRSPLYLRIEEVDGASGDRRHPRSARAAPRLNRDRLIDRDAVFTLKSHALETIWKSVRERDDDHGSRRSGASSAGCESSRPSARLPKDSAPAGGSGRPSTGTRRSPAVARLAAFRQDPRADAFHQWLQYQVDRQLERASAAMPVMQDLPIGFDAGGRRRVGVSGRPRATA